MRIEDIEIHAGQVDFPHEPVRRLEVRCEAPTALSKAPTIDDVNQKLRELAAGIGANAVVDVRYESGATWTSFRSVRGFGLAVKRLSDDIPCPICAETIKRAAKKCRFCGADIPEQMPAAAPAQVSTPLPQAAPQQEPLRSTDNPQTWAIAVAIIVVLFFILALLGQ